MRITKKLPKIDISDSETGCCPRFHPKDWDEKLFRFNGLQFAMASSKNFLHMPINLGRVMKKSMNKITEANAHDPDRYLVLSQEVSNWKSNHYFLVTDYVPTMDMVIITGTFLTKAYAAEYKEVAKLIKKFKYFITKQGYQYSEEDLYVFYTTCPQCAEHYGENYMVFFQKIED
ncbi:MAG: hypothetical protein N4A76_00185 [Firmicutes bacterium]|jgi:hypothetical protein|nr:hypothetical protein [Bacillota bacterium]